jgi:hypothetical protein
MAKIANLLSLACLLLLLGACRALEAQDAIETFMKQ